MFLSGQTSGDDPRCSCGSAITAQRMCGYCRIANMCDGCFAKHEECGVYFVGSEEETVAALAFERENYVAPPVLPSPRPASIPRLDPVIVTNPTIEENAQRLARGDVGELAGDPVEIMRVMVRARELGWRGDIAVKKL